MKVVLFCGGMGMRLRDYSHRIPKPMVTVGSRPLLWNLMEYYAHFGHTEFILCLGHGSSIVKEYFLSERPSAWNITFVDTGLYANIGQRLKAVSRYVDGDRRFLANYSDVLSDLHLPDLIEFAESSDTPACFAAVRPNESFHLVELDPAGKVQCIRSAGDTGILINGGFFVLKPDVFKYLEDGDDLVGPAFERLRKNGLLCAYRHDGFWMAMDTFKDKQVLDDLVARGRTPWQVWKTQQPVERLAL